MGTRCWVNVSAPFVSPNVVTNVVTMCTQAAVPVWQWYDDEGHWQPFRPAASTKAEREFQKWQQGQEDACIITTTGTFRKQRVLLDFDSMRQVNVASGKKRAIRRAVPGARAAPPDAASPHTTTTTRAENRPGGFANQGNAKRDGGDAVARSSAEQLPGGRSRPSSAEQRRQRRIAELRLQRDAAFFEAQQAARAGARSLACPVS